MTTVILGPRPRAVENLIETRRRLGQDRHDEVWEGDYHMAPYASARHGWFESQIQYVLLPEVAPARPSPDQAGFSKVLDTELTSLAAQVDW